MLNHCIHLKFLLTIACYTFCGIAGATDFDSELRKYLKKESPSSKQVEIALSVVDFSEIPKGKILFKKDFSSPDKLTHLASTSKHMTGAAIGLLIQREQISIENLVSDYLPQLPEYTRGLKIKHLLAHSSGLSEYSDSCAKDLNYDPHQVLDFLNKKDKLLFSAGTRHRYTNTNYVLLALVVEKITGKSFPQFMRTEFWQPLEMNQTWIRPAEGNKKPLYDLRTNYFHNKNLGYFPIPKLGCEFVFGDGGVFTTLDDLKPWAGMLLGHGPLDITTLEQMRTSFTLNNGKSIKYGFGMRGPMGESPWISYGHSGSWAGARTAITLIPEQQIAIFVLANGSDIDAKIIASQVLKLLKKYSAPLIK